jgi:hypothetical protein
VHASSRRNATGRSWKNWRSSITCRGRCAKRHRATVQCDTSNGQRGPRRKRNNQDFSGRPSTRTARDERLNDKASRERTASAAASKYACWICGMNVERLRKKSTWMFTFIRRWQSGQDVPIKTPPQDRCKRECRRISPVGPPARGCDCAHRNATCRFGNSLTCAPPMHDPSQCITGLLTQIQ